MYSNNETYTGIYLSILYTIYPSKVKTAAEGAVHNGHPQRRGGGMVKCGHLRTGGEEVKDLADVRKMALFKNCFSMLCRHSLWVMAIKI